MFLWVSLQFNSLAETSILGDVAVRNALEDLPAGMNDSYFRILTEIERKRPAIRCLALRALQWVCYAQRPLWLKELQSALLNSEDKTAAQSFDIYSKDSILAACSNLLVVEPNLLVVARHRAARLSTRRSVEREDHFSVQQYFWSQDARRNTLRVMVEVSDPTLSHATLALVCLSRLMQPYMHTHAIDVLLERDFFIDYTAQHFDEHVLIAQDLLRNDEVYSRIIKLLESGEPLLRNVLYLQLLKLGVFPTRTVLGKELLRVRQSLTGILVDATLLGEIPALRKRYATEKGALQALHLRCQCHSRDADRVLMRLCEQHVSVEARDKNGRTALHLVLRHPKEQFWSQILVKRGADTKFTRQQGYQYLGQQRVIYAYNDDCLGL